MNYINSLFSDPFTTKNKLEIKKHIFGVGEEREVSKLAYAFFLDFAGSPDRNNPLCKNSFSKYEYFAGSITSDRLKHELCSFLESSFSSPLSKNSRQVIEKYIQLLESSQNLSEEIDLLRSAELRLILLAASGQGAENANRPLEIEDQQLSRFTHLALEKVKALQVGEKAIFLTGSVLHETLLVVEKDSPNTFFVRYHDSADLVHSYIAHDFLFQESFWSKIYRLKFSTNSSLVQATLGEHFKELEKPQQKCPFEIRPQLKFSTNSSLVQATLGEHFKELEKPQRKCPFEIRPQCKNTCHLRCHLSVLKYEIMSSHSDLSEAYIEWNLFKESFGQFLLENPHLKDEDLRYFSKLQQAKRSDTSRSVKNFHTCVQEGKAQETLEIYEKIWRFFSGNSGNETFEKKATYEQVQELRNAETQLLTCLETSFFSPDEVFSMVNQFDNPWIHNTFEIFKKRFTKRQEEFHAQLEKELDSVTSDFSLYGEILKQRACWVLDKLDNKISKFSQSLGVSRDRIRWNEAPSAANFVPMEQKKVCELLALFESHPEWLSIFEQTPCFQMVLLHGVSFGKVEQVMKILEGLPEKDQRTFHELCERIFGKKPMLKNPEAVKIFIQQYPHSPLAKKLFVIIAERAINNKEFSEFFNFVNRSGSAMPVKHICFSYLAIPENQVLDVLSTLQSLHQEIQKKSSLEKTEPSEIHFLKDALLGIRESLEKNPDLREKSSTFNVPGLTAILDECTLSELCQKGLVQEIKKLPMEKRKISRYTLEDFLISFNTKNCADGIDLLKESPCANFALILSHSLFKFANDEADKTLAGTILKAYLENAKDRKATIVNWSGLGYETLFFLLRFLIENQEEWVSYFDSEFNIINLVWEFIFTFPKNKLLSEVRPVFDAMDAESLSVIVEGSYKLKDMAHQLEASDKTPLAKIMRRTKCSNYFITLCNGYVIYEEDFLNPFNLILSDADFSNPKTLYQDIIKPIFSLETQKENAVLPKALELIQKIKAPEIVPLLIGVAFLEQGNELMANAIISDPKKLKEMSEKILS